jgi:heat-inducible transcriptional repressor
VVVELSRRDLAVLHEIVDLYIRTGAPVASRDVARSPRLGLSSATIRSIVARLEEAGLVERSHPSAGCSPTDSSLRAYVDNLEGQLRLPARAREEVLQRVAALAREPEEDIGWVAEVVAGVTHEAGVAIRPMGEEPVLEAVSLVRLSGSRALAVVVTADGALRKRAFALDEGYGRDELERISSLLSRRYRGRTLSEVRAAGDQVGTEPELDGDGLEPGRVLAVVRALFGGDEGDAEVRVAGADALAQSLEFAEIDRLRSLVNVLQDRGRLAREWRQALRGHGTRVIIGGESEVTAPGGLGMVASLFYRDGHRVGAVGVVGPRRMDYGRIVPLVELIADLVTRMLEGPGAKNA